MGNPVSKSLLKGAEEALKYAKGGKKKARRHVVKVPKEIDVLSVREKLHLSRAEFSDRFGFSPRTVEKWEQGERHPTGSARAYLTVIAYNHKVVEEALLEDSREN